MYNSTSSLFDSSSYERKKAKEPSSAARGDADMFVATHTTTLVLFDYYHALHIFYLCAHMHNVQKRERERQIGTDRNSLIHKYIEKR